MTRLALLNLLFPGAGLLIRGHLIAGGLLVVGAVLVVALLLVALGLLAPSLMPPVVLPLAGLWLVLVAVAGGLWWRQVRRERLDPVAVRALHRETVSAWLSGRSAEALAAARRLAAAAPEEAGAWDLLARVAVDAGDSTLARRARRRAEAIEAR